MASVSDLFPANAVGLRTADGAITYDLAMRDSHVFDVDPEFHALDEATIGARILGLLSKMGSPKVVKSPIYFMLRKKQLPRFINAAATYTATATTITIAAADVSKFKKGYLLMNTITREILRVDDTPAASLPVERGVGEIVGTASTDAAAEHLILYYAGAADDVKFLDFIRLGDVIYNYVGELQKSYGVDQYELDSAHVSGHDPLAVLRMDKLEEQRLDLEWNLLFSQRSKTIRSDDGRVVWTPGAIDSFCTENETDFGGTITESKIITACRSIKRHGPADRWALASPQFMEKLNDALGTEAERLAGDNVPKLLGVDIQTYQMGGLRVHFTEQPLLDDAVEDHANSLASHCFILDLDDMDLKTMRGKLMGWFKWNMNIETPGARRKEDQLVTNWSLAMRRPEHHGRWFNGG